MAQNTVLAVGTTAATSSDITVAAGAVVSVGIFTDNAAGIPGNHSLTVYMDTPSQDVVIDVLNGQKPVKVLTGPGTFRIKRRVGVTTNIGAFTET